MNITRKNHKALLSIIMTVMIIMALCLMMNLNLMQTAYAQSAEDKIAHLTEEQYSITNTDTPNGVIMKKYAENNYGKKATLSWGNRKDISIIGSDDIVKIIPEHLFKEVGIVQHIGKEYGFFIETKKPYENNDMLLSTVMLIDVENADDMFSENSTSHLKIKITPIFQADFAYVERGNNLIYSLGEQEYNFYKDTYAKDLNVAYPSVGNGFVIPIPTLYWKDMWPNIDFRQHNKYFINNASNQTSLYNVNQLNPYDDGYVAQNDMGCFFTQSDFTYDGFFLEQGKSNAKDVGSVAFSAASLAFDLYDSAKGLKSVFRAVPVAGQIISTLEMFNTIDNIAADLKDTKVSELKKIEYISYYNNKDQQIASAGGLRKDEIIAIKSNSDKQLLFGTNNSFEFNYQINCQDIKVDTRYASIINIGIVSVVSETSSITTTGQVYESTSVYTNNLKNHTDNDYKEIPNVEFSGLHIESNLNILPNFNGVAQLSPKLSGEYNIVLNNRYSKFEIYEVGTLSNGNLNYGDTSNKISSSQKIGTVASSNGVYLDCNKNYVIIADLKDNVINDNIFGRYDIVSLELELAKTNVVIGDNSIDINCENEYLKFKSPFNVNYELTLDNTDVLLHFFDSDFNIIKTSVNGKLAAVLNKGETYYFRINKTNAEQNNVALFIKDQMYVTFDNIEGISGSIESTMTVSSLDDVNLPSPERVGYDFSGWWNSLENNGKQVNNSNIIDFVQPELTLLAKWTPILYTIYYEENGGSEISNGQYIIEHLVVLNQETTRTNYVFGGWYDNQGLTGQAVEVIRAGSIDNRTYYAKWINDTFNIALNVNSADTDGVAALISSNNKNVDYNQSFTLPVPTQDGFIFNGWYKGNVQYANSIGQSLNVYSDESNIELTAKWTRETYYIKINIDGTFKWLTKDGNNFSFSNTETTIDNAIGMCPNCYIMSQIAKGGGAADAVKANLYKNGHKYLNMIKNPNDLTSLACWQGSEFGENFNNNDTINIFANYNKEQQFKIFVDGQHVNTQYVVYADYNEGFNFNNLSIHSAYNLVYMHVSVRNENNKYIGTHLAPGQRFNYSTMPDLSVGIERDGDAIYLTAVCEGKPYVVTFSNIVVNLGAKTVVYGMPYNTSNGNAFPVSAKTGYTFEGWYNGVGGTGKQIVDKSGNTNAWDISNNCTLYAKWKAKTFNVTLDFQNGTNQTSNVIATYNMAMPTAVAPYQLGYVFLGYYSAINGSGTKFYNANMSSAINWTNLSDLTVYAHWTPKTYIIKVNSNDGSDNYFNIQAMYDTTMPLFSSFAPKRLGYTFMGIYANPACTGTVYYYSDEYIGTEAQNLKTAYIWKSTSVDIELYIKWEATGMYMEVGLYCGDSKSDLDKIITGPYITTGTSLSYTAPAVEGYKFKEWWVVIRDLDKASGVSDSSYTTTTATLKNEMEVWFFEDGKMSKYYYVAFYTKNCVAEGTLITLADGSQKAVELLTGDEMLLVWNLKTGRFDIAPIVFIDSEARASYEVINLYFSDGTMVKVISEHGFWNIDLNKYVFLRNDAAQYIGHWFNKQTIDADGNMCWTKVQLNSVVIANEVTTAWSPVTAEHLCYYVNGMLSMPGGITGIINIFDVDAETMQYDQVSMQADIEKYGLFTYEQFLDIVEVPEATFLDFDIQYFKIAIGKGLITEDEIIQLVESYSSFFYAE